MNIIISPSKPKPTNQREPRSFDGWALSLVLELEELSETSFLSPLFRASPLRRATVFALLALRSSSELCRAFGLTGEPGEQFAQLIGALLTTRCQTLLVAVFGPVQGLTGFLQRTDGVPLKSQNDYRKVITLLNSPNKGDRKRAKLISLLTDLPPGRLRAIEKLDPDLLHPRFMAIVTNERNANDLNEILTFVRSRSSRQLDALTLRRAADSRPDMDLVGWARTLLLQHGDRLPAGPIASDPFFEPIVDGRDFARLGRIFRNCLATKVCDAGIGRYAYYVVQTEPKTILELRQVRLGSSRAQKWTFKELCAAGNEPVDPDLELQVLAALAHHRIGKITLGHANDVTPKLAEHFDTMSDPIWLYG